METFLSKLVIKTKFLNFLLEPVLQYFSRYTEKDSFTFVEEIRKLNAENTFMSSFHVKSLFTNVPLNEIIEISAEKLYEIDKPLLRINFL